MKDMVFAGLIATVWVMIFMGFYTVLVPLI